MPPRKPQTPSVEEADVNVDTELLEPTEAEELLAEAEGVQAEVEEVVPPTPEEKGKTHTMLTNVTHDGVVYSQGAEVELPKPLVKLFRSKGFIA